jgi:histone H2A
MIKSPVSQRIERDRYYNHNPKKQQLLKMSGVQDLHDPPTVAMVEEIAPTATTVVDDTAPPAIPMADGIATPMVDVTAAPPTASVVDGTAAPMVGETAAPMVDETATHLPVPMVDGTAARQPVSMVDGTAAPMVDETAAPVQEVPPAPVDDAISSTLTGEEAVSARVDEVDAAPVPVVSVVDEITDEPEQREISTTMDNLPNNQTTDTDVDMKGVGEEDINIADNVDELPEPPDLETTEEDEACPATSSVGSAFERYQGSTSGSSTANASADSPLKSRLPEKCSEGVAMVCGDSSAVQSGVPKKSSEASAMSCEDSSAQTIQDRFETPPTAGGSGPSSENINQIAEFIHKTKLSETENSTSSTVVDQARRRLFDQTTEPQTEFIRFTKKTRTSKSSKAGIVFPVSRMLNKLKKGRYARHVGTGAGVYMAAVLEYLVAEVLELSGNFTQFYGRKRITPRSILLTLKHDAELDQLTESVTIPEGGVRPAIHHALIPPDAAAAYNAVNTL